jgi:hypothetical protein
LGTQNNFKDSIGKTLQKLEEAFDCIPEADECEELRRELKKLEKRLEKDPNQISQNDRELLSHLKSSIKNPPNYKNRSKLLELLKKVYLDYFHCIKAIEELEALNTKHELEKMDLEEVQPLRIQPLRGGAAIQTEENFESTVGQKVKRLPFFAGDSSLPADTFHNIKLRLRGGPAIQPEKGFVLVGHKVLVTRNPLSQG